MNNLDFKENFLKTKDELISNLLELLKINSVLVENETVEGKVYPFGIGNYKCLEFTKNLATKMGFKAEIVDDVALEVEYGDGDEVVHVLCHLDVVPAIGSWTNPPFEPVIKDEKIFGRGTSDDKGPALASLYALYTLKEMNVKVDRKIVLVFGTDEESGSRCLKKYYASRKMPNYPL